MPWPPKELSPNYRTRSHRLIAVRRRDYRRACAEACWQRGIRPEISLVLSRVVFHPPTKAKRDDDNLRARFKAGRDGLADALGVDDHDFNGIPHQIACPVKGGAVVAMFDIPGI
jgi:crossover junction endodeoxyribonuclease RusA